MDHPLPAHVRERYGRETVLDTLDITIVEASADRVVLEMPVTPKVHQPAGLLHGGVSVLLAETCASMGAWISAGPGRISLGIEINANHLRSVTEGTVRATGVPLHQGRTTEVWQTTIEDEQGRTTCVSRCTVALRDLRD